MTSCADLASAGVLREQVPLAPLTTYRFGGPARYFLEAESEAVLLEVAAVLRADPQPVVVLGRGSNVVVAEAGFPGLVIQLGPGLAGLTLEVDQEVTAGGALALPKLARELAAAGRGGLEFMIGIPGSVGGAVRMNAGCHGSDTAEWLVSARVVDLRDGSVAQRSPIDLDLSYRHSNLSESEVVVSARWRTVPRPRRESEEQMRAVTRWRRDHQPGGTLNAGSVFKNPPGDAAGRIIDALGLKGLAVGGAAVSPRHANFFEASPEASPRDVYDLVAEVRRRVREATGIDLEPELRFLGEFGHR